MQAPIPRLSAGEASPYGGEMRAMAEYAGVVGLARDIAWTGIPHEFGVSVTRPLEAITETATPGILVTEPASSDTGQGQAALETPPVPVNAQGEPVDMSGYRAEQAARQAVAEALAAMPSASLHEAHFRAAA